MKLDRIPSPLRPADAQPPTYSAWWIPLLGGWLMSLLGFGSIAVFGFTGMRLLFGLTGAVLVTVAWSRRN